MQVGDIVTLKKYGKSVLYKIDRIDNDKIILKGLFHRTSLIIKETNRELSVVSVGDTKNFADNAIKANEAKIKNILKDRAKNLPKTFAKPKLLHIDSDANYLEVCLKFYNAVGIDAVGYSIDEPSQPKRISKLLEEHNPDIVVMTGHDIDRDDNNIEEITDYENSIYFVESTKNARIYEPSKEGLIIIAGACQSDYESIMKAGANFASSPERIMIDVLDPCYVAERVAYTHFTKTITPKDAVKFTTTNLAGIGGVESMGVLRLLEPEYK